MTPSPDTKSPFRPAIEYTLLGVLAVLWGTSYFFIRIAVVEIPPLTLIALRVCGAAAILGVILAMQRKSLPRSRRDWALLLGQSVLNASGAWVVLAWGQQHVDSALATVLNSTSPLFVVLLTLGAGHALPRARIAGAALGLTGVVLIVGVQALSGIGTQITGALACLLGAAMYAGAALNGRRLALLGAVVTAAGTMICAAVVLVPLALIVDQPWHLRPSVAAWGAAAGLSILSTALALMIYFRLIRTLGPLGVASQAYLRIGVGVALGVVLLGETLPPSVVLGLCAAAAGVYLINRPAPARTS